jgi:Protein of unknown function, DUF255
MKKIFLLLFLPISIFAQGVNFQKGGFQLAFDEAKRQNKPLLIEVFSPTCHVCQSFMPIFDGQELGSYINPVFVSYKIDVGSEEFKAFEKKYKIFAPSLPLMVFFDAKGDFMHHGILGENQGANEVRTIVNTALDPARRSSVYKSAFLKGNRETNFLIEYSMLTKIQKDTATNIKTTAALFSSYSKAELSGRTSWLILYKLILDVDNGFFKHWVNNSIKAKEFSQGQEIESLENIIFSSLYSNRGGNYSSKKIEELKSYLIKLGRSSKDANRMTLLPYSKALIKENASEKAAKGIDAYFVNASPATAEVSYILKMFNDNSKDANYFNSAKNWLKIGAEANKGHKELASLHFESAVAHNKAGLKATAQKIAKMALSEAMLAQMSLTRFQKLNADLK